jgi:hypothetical protein
VERAIMRGADMSIIEKIVDLQIRMDEREERQQMIRAKAEFREAMAEFKKNAPGIVKKRVAEIKKDGKTVGTYNFAELDDYSEPISAGLAAVGVTHDYKLQQTPTMITVTCILSKGIYSTDGDATLSAGPDTGGCKSPVQAIASTVSMLQKYTLCAATGMSAGMADNDGAPTNGELAEALKKIEEFTSLEKLQEYFLDTVQPYKEAKNSAACNALIQAKDKRKAQLQKPAQPQAQKEGTATPREDGAVEIDCTILDVRAKVEEKDGNDKVTKAGYVRIGINSEKPITCWHQHLWPALSTAKKNDRGIFVVKEAKGYLNLEDVELIGTQKFKDGKPVLEGE